MRGYHGALRHGHFCHYRNLTLWRDGTVRYAIDYRKLNSVTEKEVYLLPLIEECIDSLTGNKWFSKLDANSAYYQVKMKEEDKQKTAFITKFGLYQFTSS
jgi:hypothetical protein